MNLTPRPPATTSTPAAVSATPAADVAPSSPAERLVIDTTEMTRLLAQGQAQYLSRIVHSFARHDGHWWLDNTTEWLRITDQDYTTRLDQLADQ